MAELGHLRAFMDSMGLVGLKAANRFGGALTDAEGNKYTFERAASDTLGFYNDVLAALLGLVSGEVAVPTPSVTMTIKFGTSSATATVSLGLGTDPLEVSDLIKVGLPSSPRIPRANVALTPSPPDLKIEVKNLASVNKGLYKGLVSKQATNEPVLEILLRIVS